MNNVANLLDFRSPGLFEQSFFANFKYWVRYYDPETKKPEIKLAAEQQWECYEPSDYGEYSNLYNPGQHLRLQKGKSDFARNRVSPISPVDLVPRDEYRNRYHLDPRIMYLDIETHTGTVVPGFPSPDKALEPISLIQFLDSETDVVHIIGDRDFYYRSHYLSLEHHKGAEVIYHHCENEREMFAKFFGFIKTMKPAVVYAWNGAGFDFGYLYNRAKRLGLDVNQFSPFAEEIGGDCVQARENYFGNSYALDIQAAGCYYIDIKRLYQKIVLAPRDSYALNAIAEVELKAKKIQHQEFKTFEDFYQGNYVKPANPTEDERNSLCYKMTEAGADYEDIRKAGHGQFVYYGVIDVVLLRDIDRKKRLTALMTKITERLNSQYDAILGTTKPWANYIRNVLFDKQIVVDPNSIAVDLEKSIQGGYVRTPVRGKQKWLLSEDANSMYPILAIAGSNMSPETFRFARDLEDPELKDFAFKYLKVGTSEEQNEANLLELIQRPELVARLKVLLDRNNLAMAPNGTFYDKSKEGVIPGLVKSIYKERKVAKKAMFVKEQQLVKVEAILKSRGLRV